MNNEQVKKLNELSKEERNALYQPLPEYKGLQKCPWGIFVSISSILWSVLLIAFFAVWFIFDAIAGQTHSDAGAFDSWWQVLMFVVAIIMFVVDAISIFFYRKLNKEKTEIKKQRQIVKIPVIFSKTLFAILTVIFIGVFFAVEIGGDIARKNNSWINSFLGIQNYEIIYSEEGEVLNAYVSDFMNSDGTFNDKAMREYSLKVATQTATEGTVLLSNNDNALPLKKNSNVSFFGISTAKYLFSAAGSGHLNVSVSTSLLDACKSNGINVNPKLTNAYKMLSSSYGNYLQTPGLTLSGTSIGDKCYVEYGINEAPWEELDKTSIGNVSSSFENYGDAAIYVISRNDGEDGDTNYNTPECIDGNYLDLAYEEVKYLENLIALKEKGVFKKVILLINAAQPMQMKNILKYDLDACVWLGVAGNVSYEQIAQIISGNANPSGRLIDTYVYDNYSAPSSVNIGDFEFANTDGLPETTTYSHNDKYVMYGEGIYIGYRYYETRYEDVVLNQGNATSSKGVVDGSSTWNYSRNVIYPFGYGLSYTTFEQSNFKVNKVAGGYEVSVKVTNTGSVAGKDVVQIYLQKPYTEYDKTMKIEKSSVELVGYDKTKTLEPNESEVINIFVSNEEFKTYDSYGYKTYIVEAGDYYLTSGNNCHDALNNILANKGKTIADGMDYDGKANFVEKITIKDNDITSYSTSTATGYAITNQFDNADPTIYEGTKDQFANYKYLSRSDWDMTYPTPIVMDVTTTIMKKDMQYKSTIIEDASAKMPTFGASGALSLIQMWGLDFDDPQWQKLLDQVTWEEAVTLVTYGGGTTGCVSVLAPDALAKDGPAGIGVANKNLSNIMCFPSECNMAATFNDELIEELGNAFGMEILHVGYTGIYGPGANIHRSAFSGRNWEYYSEDPFISSRMLTSEVKGLQNRGVIVFTKHFLLNDVERNRYGVTVWANEQSIREIYLKAFENAVVEGDMNGIMSSFNRIGAVWSGKHKGLLTEVLRNEWGFVGVVQTDAYVGTHMHEPLAESIIAGNDFTMGGANPTALDAYRNNPTVATALRDCVHRILYTKLYSNVMNGLTVNSKIVYHTSWWEVALDVLYVASISLFAISFAMLLASIILPIIKIRKYYTEQIPENKDKKVKYFFDVLSKKVTFISSVVILMILAGGIVAIAKVNKQNSENPIITQPHECEACEVCGGCLDETCSINPCICGKPCEHACYVCGLCIDEESTEVNCMEKCGAHYSSEEVFEIEDTRVYKYAGDLGSLSVAQEEGSDRVYVGNLNANLGATVKIVVESNKDTSASLYVSVSKRLSSQLYTNNVLVTVNGNIIESKGIVEAVSGDEQEWVTFTEVCLGCIDLVEGRNVIQFVVINGDVGAGFNFDSVKIRTDAVISYYTGEHICDDICSDCGSCMNKYCTDTICLNKCTCNIEIQEFLCENLDLKLNGASYMDGAVLFNSNNQTASFEFKAENNCKAILLIELKYGGVQDINDLLRVKVNGKYLSYIIESIESDDFISYKLGMVDLDYGINNIEFICIDSEEVLLRSVQFGCDTMVKKVNPHEFLITSDYVIVEGFAYKNSENVISMNENAMGSVISFPIGSNKATTADLYFSLASRSNSAKISDILKISINGKTIETVAVLPTEGREFFTYTDVLIANITLNEGPNDIIIEVLTNNQSINTNLKYISFAETDATLSWSDSSSLYNRTIIEAESVTINAAETVDGLKPFISNGENASGDKYLGGVNDAGLFNPGEATLIFKVNSSASTQAKFYFNLGISGTARASSYSVVVNGDEYTSNQTWTGEGWYAWKNYYFCRIDLLEGENVIVIRIDGEGYLNMDYFMIESTEEITLITE